ncbi:ABC transporter permease subunit [Paenibacillus donghaensis]|uniref:ABC transporter permease n=1 Tax=Paenibacillus donghaensis TaxID=414771 RepID=A0A2Z2KUS3_9BACL|nr:ABC transporter permease subunit [Paenibacillus donghaensis]ASA23528.1 hypothetical protein B9T62_23660 [Paenibacillus donghaensis]
MKWNLIKQEWRQNARGFWICLTTLLLLIVLLLSKADAFIGNPDMTKLLDSLPRALRDAFGIDGDSFASFEGYAASQVYPYAMLTLACFSAVWAAGTVVKERDRGTGEFLFTLPYSRLNIFFSKIVAQLVLISLIFVICSAVTWLLGAATVGVESPSGLLLMLFSGYLLTLAFAGMGYGLTSWFQGERAAWSTALGLVLGSFMLNMFSGGELVDTVRNLSLFRLFDPASLVRGAGLTAAGCTVTLGLYIAGIALGAFTLRRRDLL